VFNNNKFYACHLRRVLMKITQPKVLISGFALAIALLCGIAWLEFYHNTEMRKTSALVARTQAGETELRHLLSLMIDVETGVRGYVITGEPAYLNPFTLAVEGLERQRKLVRSLISADERQAALTELDQLLLRRVELARGVIQIRNERGLDVARIKRQMDIGKETMDQVRALVQRMEAEQEALIKSAHCAIDC
jgi:CHASE3 domain sensor protein